MSDIVASIEITLKNGQKYAVPVERRGDPVETLDKFLTAHRIALTDSETLQCKVSDPAAITAKACEAVVSVLLAIRQRTARTSESL